MHITRSQIHELVRPDAFQWLAAIEDTFITTPSPKTGRTLDEYELTGHYGRWKLDLDLFAELGLRSVRYGIPWHRISPARGTWNFSWTDQVLGRLLELGIQPVVDLVHYGLPPWIEGAWLHPDFPELMAEYAARVAERYKGRIFTYTPLNEPRITAWYCGKLGWWPPARRGWRGFLSVMIAACRGIVRTVEEMTAVDPDIVAIHVDATDLYEAATPDLEREAGRRQDIVFLALDLVTGRIDDRHSLHSWLLTNGVSEAELGWFRDRALTIDLLGLNLYPLFTRKRLLRTPRGLRTRMPYGSASILERLAEMYWSRYRCPLFVSETASAGRRRLAWLEDSVEAVARVRARGIPLVGYTWWPLFALVTWGYREGRKSPAEYLLQMGLWNLEPTQNGLERVPTALVERYREIVAGGADLVGRLAAAGST
ncbi:MAG TPA: family 1 glycosylhydrolase [Candidatus Binatia bacterium]